MALRWPECRGHYLAGLALVSGMTKREKLTLIFEELGREDRTQSLSESSFEAFDSDYDHCLLYSQDGNESATRLDSQIFRRISGARDVPLHLRPQGPNRSLKDDHFALRGERKGSKVLRSWWRSPF